MSTKKEKTTIVTIQEFDFDLKGMKGLKKTDFLKTWKDKQSHEDEDGKLTAKGRVKRFDAEKAWDSLEKALKK